MSDGRRKPETHSWYLTAPNPTCLDVTAAFVSVAFPIGGMADNSPLPRCTPTPNADSCNHTHWHGVGAMSDYTR